MFVSKKKTKMLISQELRQQNCLENLCGGGGQIVQILLRHKQSHNAETPQEESFV